MAKITDNVKVLDAYIRAVRESILDCLRKTLEGFSDFKEDVSKEEYAQRILNGLDVKLQRDYKLNKHNMNDIDSQIAKKYFMLTNYYQFLGKLAGSKDFYDRKKKILEKITSLFAKNEKDHLLKRRLINAVNESEWKEFDELIFSNEISSRHSISFLHQIPMLYMHVVDKGIDFIERNKWLVRILAIGFLLSINMELVIYIIGLFVSDPNSWCRIHEMEQICRLPRD